MKKEIAITNEMILRYREQGKLPKPSVMEQLITCEAKLSTTEADLAKARQRLIEVEEAGQILKEIAQSHAMQTYDRSGTIARAVKAWEEALRSFNSRAGKK